MRLTPEAPYAIWRVRPAREMLIMARAKPVTLPSDPLWYKDAVIYQLHVKSFFDSNNDGVGDFPGLIKRLDYLAEVGINAHLAAAVLPVAAPRRRLRHRRLSRRPSGIRQRSRRCAPSSAKRTRAAFASSPNLSSITPPTSTPGSSGRGARSRARQIAISMSGRTPTGPTPARASFSSTPRSRTGRGTTKPRPISGTVSIRISRI